MTFQCKILIVPEEGWFGQPKYSTHKKIIILHSLESDFQGGPASDRIGTWKY